MKRLIQFFVDWRIKRFEAMELEYQELQKTINQCLKENMECRVRLQSDNSGAASALALIRHNNQTITILSSRQECLGRKLGYV